MSDNVILVPGKLKPFQYGTPLMDEKDIKKTSQVDSEDVKTEGGVLKFADKAYVPNDFSGMGRVYLRKNMINASLHFADIISDLPSTETETLFDCDEIVYETTNNRFLAVKHTSEGKKYYPNYQFTGSEDYSEPDNKHIYVCDANAKLYTYENGALEETTTLMDKNVLTQDMMNKPNTIYIIQYDYDIVDMVNDTTTNNLTIGGEYYSYKPITIEDNQTYRALNDCVFVDYRHNSFIGSVLVTGENESQDFAIAKKSSAASGVPVSYYNPNGAINVPANCVLQFEGGSIKNGTIVGNGTKIEAGNNVIFNNISFDGTFSTHVNINWFTIHYNDSSYDNSQELNTALYLCHLSDYKSLTLNANSVIYINPVDPSYKASFTQYYIDGKIRLYDGVCFDLNGSTIAVIPNNSVAYNIIFSKHSENIAIKNGTVQGDITGHTGSTGEWGYGISLMGVHGCVIENVVCKDCWGDGINLDVAELWTSQDEETEEHFDWRHNKDIVLRNVTVVNNRRNGMSICAVDGMKVYNSVFENARGTNPQCGVDVEPGHSSNIAKNILFEMCSFINNYNSGFIIDNNYGAVEDVTIDSCITYNNSYAYSLSGTRITLRDMRGTVWEGLRLMENLTDFVISNCKFKDLTISGYTTIRGVIQDTRFEWNTINASPGLIYAVSSNGTVNIDFERCSIDAKSATLGNGALIYIQGSNENKAFHFKDCELRADNLHFLPLTGWISYDGCRLENVRSILTDLDDNNPANITDCDLVHTSLSPTSYGLFHLQASKNISNAVINARNINVKNRTQGLALASFSGENTVAATVNVGTVMLIESDLANASDNRGTGSVSLTVAGNSIISIKSGEATQHTGFSIPYKTL